MFASSSNAPQRTLVTLTLADGKKVIVSVKLAMSGRLGETLNNQDQFLDVISGSGESYFIAKSQVVKAEAADPPQAKLNQHRRASDQTHFNPWAVLGLESSASKEELRQAYLNLVKMYHPDRMANYDLPAEMKDYAAAMLARINLAYEQVGG